MCVQLADGAVFSLGLGPVLKPKTAARSSQSHSALADCTIPQEPAYTGLMESKMLRKLLLTLPLLVLPDMALAEMGGGTDRDRVNLQVQAMMRDGRWERTIAEGRSNRLAFEALRQAQARVSQPATRYTTSDAVRRRAKY